MATRKSTTKGKRSDTRGSKAAGAKAQDSVASVIENEMSGWSMVARSRASAQHTLSGSLPTAALDAAAPSADAVMPSIDALQQRYQVGMVLLVDDLRALGCETVVERDGRQHNLADNRIAVLARLRKQMRLLGGFEVTPAPRATGPANTVRRLSCAGSCLSCWLRRLGAPGCFFGG